MKKLYILAASVAIFATATAQQTTVTEWTFDRASTAATTGNGTISYAGGATSSVNNFVAGNPSNGLAYSTTNYPAQSTANKTAGVVFAASTAGYTGIVITVDIAGSDTASKYVQLQYTVDGGATWVNAEDAVALDKTFTTISRTLSGAADEQANFAFRVVSAFNTFAGNTSYEPISAGFTYSPAGTWTIDNARIRGVKKVLGVANADAAKRAFVKNTSVENNLFFGAKSDVKIISMNGQVVKSASVNDGTSLDLSGLAKGMYIVTGTVNGEKVSQKIIKK